MEEVGEMSERIVHLPGSVFGVIVFRKAVIFYLDQIPKE